jgi:general secretion pathway protein G
MSKIAPAVVAVLLLLSACDGRDMDPRAAEAVLKTDLKTMRDCIEQFRGDRGACPSSLEELVRAGYLHKLPVDPVTRSAETWVAVPGRPADGPACAERVADVRSGSERMSLAGTPYSSW